MGEEQLPLDAINQRYHYDAPMLGALLDTLCATGFLQKNNSLYSIPETERKFLLKDSPDYKLGIIGVTFTYDHLAGLERRLESKENIFEPSAEEWQAVTNATKRFVHPFMNLVREGKIGDIGGKWIDVGTGQGDYLLELALYEQNFYGLGLDTCPRVIQSAEATSKDYKGKDLSDKVIFSTDDFLEVDGSGYDTVMFNHLFHGVGEEMAIKFLEKAQQFASRVVIQEVCKTGYQHPITFLADINFRLSLPNGRVFWKSEIEEMVKHSGFKKVESIPLHTDSPGFYVMVGYK